MKYAAVIWIIVVVLAVSDVALYFKLRSLETKNAAMKESAPGLGEYMTTIQLHAGKLWFAAKAANWELAAYELDEMKETMEAAKSLGAEKNGVKIAAVLDSVLRTQLPPLEEAVKAGRSAAFQKSYDAALAACNGCHAEAGYKFIRIVRPVAPPVPNQRWEPAAKPSKP